MQRFRTFPMLITLLLGVLFGSAAHAQVDLSGQLTDVRVAGTQTYGDIIRTIITSRPGTVLEAIDLEAERNRIYALGTFETVSVDLEVTAVRRTLVITVKENPRIAEVEFFGNNAVPEAYLLDIVAATNLLESGRVYNMSRADEARRTVRQVYREVGFPFDVGVDLEITLAPEFQDSDGRTPVRLTYEIDESATVRKLSFAGNTVFTDSELQHELRGLLENTEFSREMWQRGVQNVAKLYADHGYRNSGVNLETSVLEDGLMHVEVRELTVASIDTTALGIDASELSLEVGDLFNYDTLLADVERITKGRSSDVQLQAGMSSTGGVRVSFVLGAPATAGPIDEIVFSGNTVATDEELSALLTLQEGETFNSILASEDYDRILRFYQERGYRLIPRADFSYHDGVYTQRIVELRIADYRIDYEGEESHTQERVITRYLPSPGEVLNEQEMVARLTEVAQLQVVEVVGFGLDESTDPEFATVVLQLKSQRTGTFSPALQYATDRGLSASLSFEEGNLFGLAHTAGASVSVASTDIGLMVGGALTYAVPWLDVDFLDFRDVPTSFSVSLFSEIDNNKPLGVGTQTSVLYPGLADHPDNYVLVGEYASRSSGVAFQFGRPIFAHTTLNAGVSTSWTEYFLEPPTKDCTFSGGKVTNGTECSLPVTDAAQYLPTGGFSGFASVNMEFDNRDSLNFPTQGVNAYGGVGFGFGDDFVNPTSLQRQDYTFWQLTAGARTYVSLGSFFEGITNDNHVFAVRFDVGHQLGQDYPVTKRFFVGQSPEVARQIRGYQRHDFDFSQTYVTSSVEYRYDFNFESFATQTVIGIVFADLGWASHVPAYDPYSSPLFASAGVGVQVNLGFGGVALPPVRMDYAFSERNPTGVFSFRLGPVF